MQFNNFTWDYECEEIPYYKVKHKQSCWSCGAELRTNHTYTPDFKLSFKDGTVIYIETKGRWLPADRTKHIAVKKQHPEKDIRLIFSNPRQRLSKGSKGTYASWCAQKKILFDKKLIPVEWIQEKL